jgi:hypothetical protein
VTDTDAPFAERVQSFVIGIERTAGTAFVAVWPRPGLWICEFESCRPSPPSAAMTQISRDPHTVGAETERRRLASPAFQRPIPARSG